MNKSLAAIIITAILSGCQTADEMQTTSATPISVTGATASAIAGDMASRLAEQVGPARLGQQLVDDRRGPQVREDHDRDARVAFGHRVEERQAARRVVDHVGPAGATTLKMEKDTSEYAAALEAALKGWGYTVATDEKVGKDQKPVEFTWSIDSFDGQVLAQVSTPAVALGRVYTATSSGATPASPLSVMQRN